MKEKYALLSISILKISLLIIASASLISYIVIAIIRINYPFELEWIEEGIVVVVARLAQGLPIYTQPSLEYVPFVYTPLFYFLSALVAKFVGIGFAPLRIVSFLSSMGILMIVFLFVKRETRDTLSAFLSSCFFVSCYSAVAFWFDIGRVDSLAIFLLISAFYIIRFHLSYPGCFFAGLLIALSYLAKQEGLSLSLPIILYLFFVEWKKAITVTITLLLSLSLGIWILDIIYNGYFIYYTIQLPLEILHDSIQLTRLISLWTKDLIKLVPILFIMVMYFIIFAKKQVAGRIYWFYIVMIICLILGALPYRTILYGYINALIPAFLITAIIGGISFNMINKHLNEKSSQIKTKYIGLFYIAIIIQFIIMIYTPFEVIPSANQYNNEKALIDEIKDYEGEVFMPSHSYIAILAGKSGSLHIGALDAILFNSNSKYRDSLYKEIINSFKAQKYSAIVLDQFWITNGDELMDALLQNYEIKEDPNGQTITYKLFNQNFYRPTVIYIPKKPAPKVEESSS